MLVIRNHSDLVLVSEPKLRALLAHLLAEASGVFAPYASDDYGWFVVLEPGDNPNDADRIGCRYSLLTSPDGEVRYGEDGFVPIFEWVTDHGEWYEGLVVLSDAGDFVSVLIPNRATSDPSLLALCAEMARATPVQ